MSNRKDSFGLPIFGGKYDLPLDFSNADIFGPYTAYTDDKDSGIRETYDTLDEALENTKNHSEDNYSISCGEEFGFNIPFNSKDDAPTPKEAYDRKLYSISSSVYTVEEDLGINISELKRQGIFDDPNDETPYFNWLIEQLGAPTEIEADEPLIEEDEGWYMADYTLIYDYGDYMITIYCNETINPYAKEFEIIEAGYYPCEESRQYKLDISAHR